MGMGWWPFKRREKPLNDDPHIKGTRVWLTELREMCERNFDNHVEGQRRISELQIEWKEAHKEAENDWLAWLDNEEFWQPGWRGDDGEPSGESGMN